MARRQPPKTPAAWLQTSDGQQLAVPGGPRLRQAAMAWSYIARHRIRWQRNRAARADLAKRAVRQLQAINIDEPFLDAIARSRLVEVSVPWGANGGDASARLMPWEYVLSAAVREHAETGIVVVRHLAGGRRAPAARRARSVAVVLGAVAALEDCYQFETECTLAERTLGIPATLLEDPTPADLGRRIRQKRYDVIHVGGVDMHQGLTYLDAPMEDLPAEGGLFLTDDDARDVVVPAPRLAGLLSGGGRKPQLVVFNLYHSAAHIAPHAVAAGATAALGFQDTFDDLRAELFIGEFYRAWQASNGNPLVAFHVAWRAMSDLPDPLAGSGLVLWSARSLVATGMKALQKEGDEVRDRLAHRRRKGSSFRTAAAAAGALDVTLKPLERLNYALLHNRQPLFERFELRNLDEQRRLEGVRVEVEMFAGPERLPFATTMQVADAPVAVHDRIFLPLTSALVRNLNESIRAGVHVKVSVGSQSVSETSHRVTLLPTDEWVDDDENRQWLPSFVFPQDPAVAEIVEAARKYLTFLSDSAAAGFDGYQSVDWTAERPTEAVDWQVEAIWSALVHAFSLGYINPPPTYTEQSQRLRHPSRVLRSHEGTCIDLALLLASCLEYVGIYPVIFLLDGHAFPGYWRSEESWDEFINMRGIEQVGLKALERLTAMSGPVDQKYPWVFPDTFYSELMKQIDRGNLVPLETVWLTSHSKFEEAQDGGMDNLVDPSEFHSLIDITMARECDVTPLPRVEDRP